MYSQVFHTLKDNSIDVFLMPSLFTCDFESGLIGSIRLDICSENIRGCYFHFCQAVAMLVDLCPPSICSCVILTTNMLVSNLAMST